MYHKMQREKLFNLHTATYFIAAIFVFEIDKILSNQVVKMRKRQCFRYTTNSFLLFHCLSPDMLYQKKNKIHHKMQREKLYNLHSKAYCRLFSKKEKSMEPIISIPKT